MASSSEAQNVVNLSLKKILASRNKRGGIDLHRNLLLASVLFKARDACIEARTYDPGYRGDDGNMDDAATSVANNDERDDIVDSRKDDVTSTSDAVPSYDEETKECPEGVRWDVIPDQALEEWNFLGPDICSEQLEPEVRHQPKSDTKGPTNESVDDDEAVKNCRVRDVTELGQRSSDLHTTSLSRKRTIEIELIVADSNESGHSVSRRHKRQKTDQNVNTCENMCLDFDDLINSLEGDCSITAAALETSKDCR